MRHVAVLLLALCLLTAVSSVSAGAIADSVAFQGRLTDASDNPVPDGPVDLVLSFWSDSIGGTMYYTETHGVVVKRGLYATCIGCNNDSFFDIFTDSSIWLEVQLAGQPAMTPRTPIRYTPKAMLSARVRGDITTSPDHLTVGDLDGDGALDLVSTADVSEMTVARKRPGRVKFQNITMRAFADSTLDTRDCDDDDDGVPESAFSQRLTPTTASLAINTKGTGAKRLAMGGDCDDTDASVWVDGDDDGDGVPERAAEFRITPTTSSMAINTKGTGAKRLRAGGDCDDTDASFYLDYDDDGDGVSETSMSSTVERKSGSIVYLDREGNEVLRSMMGVDSTRSVITLDRDSDGDGVQDLVISSACEADSVYRDLTFSPPDAPGYLMKAKEKANRTKCSNNLRCVTPTADNNTEISVDSSGALLSASHGGGGGGGGILQCFASTDPAVGSGIAIDEPGVHLEGRCSDDGSGTYTGEFQVTVSGAKVASMGSSGVGFFGTAVGVGVLSPLHPIEVTGGAYCDGSNWVNASDANAKENFTPVDGQELLEKIDNLEITRWNYKTDPETEHIGPTAQDFQATFGVGSDGKSISTIDPSGIALAAIKELAKQNDQLRSQNADLQKQLDDLKRTVEQLAGKK